MADAATEDEYVPDAVAMSHLVIGGVESDSGSIQQAPASQAPPGPRAAIKAWMAITASQPIIL